MYFVKKQVWRDFSLGPQVIWCFGNISYLFTIKIVICNVCKVNEKYFKNSPSNDHRIVTCGQKSNKSKYMLCSIHYSMFIMFYIFLAKDDCLNYVQLLLIYIFFKSNSY